jgi:hypothetical protein
MTRGKRPVSRGAAIIADEATTPTPETTRLIVMLVTTAAIRVDDTGRSQRLAFRPSRFSSRQQKRVRRKTHPLLSINLVDGILTHG